MSFVGGRPTRQQKQETETLTASEELAFCVGAPPGRRGSDHMEPEVDLSLNNGNLCPEACVDRIKSYADREAMRRYSEIDNLPLKQAVAGRDGVSAKHVYLANGSGPLLKQCIPHVIRSNIKSSAFKTARHLINGMGFPLLTATFTYSKVPQQGRRNGLSVRLLPMTPETGMRVSPDDIAAELMRQDSFVYLCNPNNPTGQLTLAREPLIALLERFPGSRFWIDEAYVQYLELADYQPVSDLVVKYPHLMVSRSFSFAYGLAAARIGYLIASPELVATFEGQGTGYKLGLLQQDLALAALADTTHLPEVRRRAAEGRATVGAAMRAELGVEVFDSSTNFILARFTDGRTGAALADAMLRRGVRIKTFTPVEATSFESFFRITLGTSAENDLCSRVLPQAYAETRVS